MGLTPTLLLLHASSSLLLSFLLDVPVLDFNITGTQNVVQEKKIVFLQHTTHFDVPEVVYMCLRQTNHIYQKSSKTNCKAKICIIVCDGLSRVFLEHKHASSPKKSHFQQSHNKMGSYAKRRLELNDYAGISLNKSFHFLVVEAEGYDNLPFGETDCRSYITKVRQLRLGVGHTEALCNYSVHMQKRSSNLFYMIDMDDEGRMQNVFSVDARSRAAYKSFEDSKSPWTIYLIWMWFAFTRGYRNICMVIQVMVRMHEWTGTKSNNNISMSIDARGCGIVIKKTLKTLLYESTHSQEFEDGWCKLVENYKLEKIMSGYALGVGICKSKLLGKDQYDNTLKSKIEKETKVDFQSLNSSYKLVTGILRDNFTMHTQMQFLNSFKMSYEVCCIVILHWSKWMVHDMYFISQILWKGNMEILKTEFFIWLVMMRLHVIYNALVICLSFKELFILIEKDVKEIHPRYILSRWRKDVKHGHYLVINCYDDLMSIESAKQFDHLCSNFYEIARIANSREKYEYLLNCINIEKEKLNDDSIWGCSSNGNLIVNDVRFSDSTTKLLPPLQVLCKGRPPSKRKESRVEQVMKKKRKKNVPERTENIQQDQTDSSCEHGAISYNEEPSYGFDLNVPMLQEHEERGLIDYDYDPKRL
uniref:Protein FAR1-RELATED SEQUENCE n=1 Tax=Lactuca sativa TaxID=4236 RepID=A0A9R1VFW8_LACSA|nr:hypothetical protein LSAT_V11C500248790 [Lactuca sativa]